MPGRMAVVTPEHADSVRLTQARETRVSLGEVPTSDNARAWQCEACLRATGESVCPEPHMWARRALSARTGFAFLLLHVSGSASGMMCCVPFQSWAPCATEQPRGKDSPAGVCVVLNHVRQPSVARRNSLIAGSLSAPCSRTYRAGIGAYCPPDSSLTVNLAPVIMETR
jgi:hypothetical protein